MVFRPVIFEDLDHSAKEILKSWVPLIPPRTNCKIKRYPNGNEIQSSDEGVHGLDFSLPIGFILSGRVELSESYVFRYFSRDRMAYRPIRVLSPGDLFGEFSVLDTHLGCEGVSRRGETWKLHSGARSVFIAQDNSSYDESFIQEGSDDDPIKPHLILRHLEFGAAEVLFIDGATVAKDNQDFLNGLLMYAWSRAKIYRDCLNSFNFNEFLIYKEKAQREYESLENDDVKYVKAKSKGAVLNVFLDAVWDACNRPLRNEPLFEPVPEELARPSLEDTKVKAPNIHIASRSLNPETRLLFPVGLDNFLIAAHAKASLEGRKSRETSKITESFERTFGTKVRKDASLPARAFYRDLATKLVDNVILPNYPNYPLDVACKDISGAHGNTIILEFIKRAEKACD